MDKIMHLRAIDHDASRAGHTQYDQSKRGVTVIGKFVDNLEQNRRDLVFSWAIQDTRDRYCKKKGIEIAGERMNSGIIIQTDYVPKFSLKYQFFNSIAAAREFYHSNEAPDNIARRRFLDLTFYSLAEIAESNNWYMDIKSEYLPSIHPDILINYIHRMNLKELSKLDIYSIAGKHPTLTALINRSYGV